MIHVDPSGLALADLLDIALRDTPAALSHEARQRIDAGHQLLLKLAAEGQPIYGVTTGLGAAVDVQVPLDDPLLQARIPLGRAVGVGRLANRQELRAIITARLAGLAQGRSGISPAAADSLLALLNAGIEPEVPLLGSLGESDLAPLAHLSLALLGEGWVRCDGERMPADQALQRYGLQPARLIGKDGLALVSANSASVGLGALLVAETDRALQALLAGIALSCEGYRANLSPFQPWASRLRPAAGQTEQSAALLRLLEGGELAANPRRLQDPLSFRCAMVVQGAAQQTLQQLREQIELELASGADNPALISEEQQVLATANFDSTHLALAGEGLGLALSRVAACSAERVAKLLSPTSSELPRFLVSQPGHVGMAALQRTSAALLAEIGHLANPLPAVSVPVADRVEDYAGQALAVIEKTRQLTQRVLWLASIELIVAAQAVDLRGTVRLGEGAEHIHRAVRSQVAHLDQDRSGSVDVLALAAFIGSGALLW
ncbi:MULTISPECIES: aromatic amino acid lyase [unclassified Pseudomonas]|uniref:HAL/PAL/TAL family ammonia-lyase n=1 Tax=unclassified Pseudomonas TaxID=196821 RepID=UPI0011EE1292|nr:MULTISPECIES: aromatic amino acid lyase [unclassified Pseudomonas]KAA0943880.1 histidine ammonia-lyase [Pseudomonas sp. ANT_H4]KAA0950970.1 histidine ammonia-lyase [Pseudomonas sp. ANT_H14]